MLVGTYLFGPSIARKILVHGPSFRGPWTNQNGLVDRGRFPAMVPSTSYMRWQGQIQAHIFLPVTEPPSGPQSVHPGTSCFLCSTLITNVPHNDHITRQIHLFKELLNEEGFKQGLVNDASSSLMYPADGRKSCTDCLTMVGKVWELDREILTLRERIRTIVQTSLRDNGKNS